MKKTHFYAIILSVFIVCCFVGMGVYSFFSPVITDSKGHIYYLRPGSSKKLVINELSQQGIIKYPILFSLFVYTQTNQQIKTGEYRFPSGATPYAIWKQIIHGTGLVYHGFTIIPGWSFTQLRQALAQAEGLRHLTATWDDKQIMTRLGAPDLAPEGEFFPETYYYTKDILDLVILKRAFDLMQLKLMEAWQHHATTVPYKTAYEALIAASLIEKEAYLNAERPIIAGVIVNRLNKDMLLQIDPTVVYGLGNRYDGKLYKVNLTEDTAYNTYVHKGLPPTPIAIPSFLSIQAAMHPDMNDYLYFVAKGNGSHQFSSTLQTHNAAVDSFRKITPSPVPVGIAPISTMTPMEPSMGAAIFTPLPTMPIVQTNGVSP